MEPYHSLKTNHGNNCNLLFLDLLKNINRFKKNAI
jgi:prepilin-type processing-associated H-X9-DG protein